MAKFELIYNGFSITEAKSSETVLSSLSEILNISETDAAKILQDSSGTLKNSDNKEELKILLPQIVALGLNASIVFSSSEHVSSGLTLDGNQNSGGLFADLTIETLGDNLSFENKSSDEEEEVLNLMQELEQDKIRTEGHLDLETIASALKDSINESHNETNNHKEDITQTQTSSAETMPHEENPHSGNISESIKAFDWGQTDALTYVKKGKRTQFLVDAATAVIIAFLTSLLFFLLDNQTKDDERLKEQAKYVESIIHNLDTERKIREKSAQKTEVIPTAHTLVGSQQSEKWDITSEFFLEKDKLKTVDIGIDTPPPPPLTDQEIVEHIKQAPWLRRILLSNMAIAQTEDNKFVASGKARGFIEHEGAKLQSLADAVVTGQIDPEKLLISGKVMINRGYGQLPTELEVTIESLPEKDYRFFSTISFQAVYKPEIKEPTK